MGFQTETFSRPQRLSDDLRLNEVERKYFTGKRNSQTKNGSTRTVWTDYQRVELNALAADVPKFIEWLDAKLHEHGVAEKLIPDDEALAARLQESFESQVRHVVETQILAKLDTNQIASEIIYTSDSLQPVALGR